MMERLDVSIERLDDVLLVMEINREENISYGQELFKIVKYLSCLI